MVNWNVWSLKCCWLRTKDRNWTCKQIPFVQNFLPECFHVTFANLFSHIVSAINMPCCYFWFIHSKMMTWRRLSIMLLHLCWFSCLNVFRNRFLLSIGQFYLHNWPSCLSQPKARGKVIVVFLETDNLLLVIIHILFLHFLSRVASIIMVNHRATSSKIPMDHPLQHLNILLVTQEGGEVVQPHLLGSIQCYGNGSK